MANTKISTIVKGKLKFKLKVVLMAKMLVIVGVFSLPGPVIFKLSGTILEKILFMVFYWKII